MASFCNEDVQLPKHVVRNPNTTGKTTLHIAQRPGHCHHRATNCIGRGGRHTLCNTMLKFQHHGALVQLFPWTYTSNGLNLLHPRNDVAEMVLFVRVSLIVPKHLVFVFKFMIQRVGTPDKLFVCPLFSETRVEWETAHKVKAEPNLY